MNKLTIKKKAGYCFICATIWFIGKKKPDEAADMKKAFALDAEDLKYSESDKKFLKKIGMLD